MVLNSFLRKIYSNGVLKWMFTSLILLSLSKLCLADMVDDLDKLDEPKPKKEEVKTNTEDNKTPTLQNHGNTKTEKKTDKPPSTDKAVESTKENVLPMPQAKNSTSSSKKSESDAARRQLPINLKSDGEATYSKDGGVVFLTKNVRISQGNLFFRSDEARAFFVHINGEEVVQKVEISGNVHLTKQTLDPAEVVKASGDKAFFYNDRSLVELVGNARLWQGGHLIKGRKITYDLASSIVKVDRAEGVVQPGE